MPFAKNLLAGSGSRFPLLRMLRKGAESPRGGIPSETGLRSRAAGLRTPEAALSLESISTGVSRRRTGLYQWYNEQLAQRPVATKAWTCFVGSVLGDALAQYATDLPFDCARNLRISLYGLLVGGPSGHFWHALLDSKIMPSRPQSVGAVLAKLGADQLLFAPLATAFFMAYLKTAEGHPELVMPFMQETLWGLLLANWTVWPAVNLVAFAFIPRDYRILYSNIIGVAWCAYMSLIINEPVRDSPHVE